MKEESIGERIYNLRKKRGLSQEDLAYKLGVSRQTVSKWETDYSIPSSDYIKNLCELFGVKADYLLSACGESCEVSLKDETACASCLPQPEANTKRDRLKDVLVAISFVMLSLILLCLVFLMISVGIILFSVNRGSYIVFFSDFQFNTEDFIFIFVAAFVLICIDTFVVVLMMLKRKRKKSLSAK